MPRRQFLAASATALAGVAAGETFKRSGAPNLRLSLAAYSFRSHFPFMRGKPRKVANRPMDMIRFIDFCADQGCDGAELTSYFFRPEVTREYLISLRRRAFLRGLELSGSAVGNNFSLPKGAARDAQVAYVKEWIDHCAVLGAPHIRVFAGREPRGVSREQADKWAIEALRELDDREEIGRDDLNQCLDVASKATGNAKRAARKRSRDELVEAGVLEPVEDDNGTVVFYRFHDTVAA